MHSPVVLHLTISNVSEQLFSGEILSVTAPGIEGEMTILAHHESIITLLKKGKITVHKMQSNDTISFNIENGVLETSNSQVTILI